MNEGNSRSRAYAIVEILQDCVKEFDSKQGRTRLSAEDRRLFEVHDFKNFPHGGTARVASQHVGGSTIQQYVIRSGVCR